MKIPCPFCEGDIADSYAEVMAAHRARRAEGHEDNEPMVMCSSCGEPMVLLDGNAARKPTHAEFEFLLNNDVYKRNRAVWLECQARLKRGTTAPVAELWKFYVAEAGLEFTDQRSMLRAKAHFYNGVSGALSYFREALGQDEEVFVGRMNLIEEELAIIAGRRDPQAEFDEKMERIGEVVDRIFDALVRKKRGEPDG